MSLARDTVEPGVERLRFSSWRGRAVGFDVSAFVLDGTLVDTGFPGARDTVLAAVRELRPHGAVITHWHEDHAGNVPALAAMGLPLSLRHDSEAILRSHPEVAAYRRVVWGRTPRLVAPVLPFDPFPLELIPTPGHTPDHQAVWDPERRILVSGDLFLGTKVRVAHEHESPRALVASLRAAAALEPRLLLDAHRGVVENAAAALREKLAWNEETIGEIERLGAEGVSARAIVRRLFDGESFVGRASGGEYSRTAFVRAVLRESAR